MSWLRQPNTPTTLSLPLRWVVFSAGFGELSQLSKGSNQQQMQCKEGGRTTYPRLQAAEGSKLISSALPRYAPRQEPHFCASSL